MRITVASSGGIAENKRRRVHVLRGASVCSHTEYWSQLLVHRYSYFASFVRSQHCRLLRSLLAAAAAAPSFRLSPLRTRETREAVRVAAAKIRERDSPCYFSRRFQRHADGVCISLFGEKKKIFVPWSRLRRSIFRDNICFPLKFLENFARGVLMKRYVFLYVLLLYTSFMIIYRFGKMSRIDTLPHVYGERYHIRKSYVSCTERRTRGGHDIYEFGQRCSARPASFLSSSSLEWRWLSSSKWVIAVGGRTTDGGGRRDDDRRRRRRRVWVERSCH